MQDLRPPHRATELEFASQQVPQGSICTDLVCKVGVYESETDQHGHVPSPAPCTPQGRCRGEGGGYPGLAVCQACFATREKQ